MATETAKNLLYISLKNYQTDLHRAIQEGHTAISNWGMRSVTVGNRSISLGELTQKIEGISRTHFSAEIRSTAFDLMHDLQELYDVTNRQLGKKTGLDRVITVFFVFFRETVFGFFRPGVWNNNYANNLWGSFTKYTDEEFRAEFPTEEERENAYFSESYYQTGIKTIYATLDSIRQKAAEEKIEQKKWGKELAAWIVQQKPKNEQIRIMCLNEGFYNDPVGCMVRWMIIRGAEGPGHEGFSRTFIISQIPGFFERVTSTEYLQAFFTDVYSSKGNDPRCREIFEESLRTKAFQTVITAALEKSKEGGYASADDALRRAFTIFEQAAKGQVYQIPGVP